MNKSLLRARMKPWCWWFRGGLLPFLLVSGRLRVELPVGGGYRVERYPPLVYHQVVPPPQIMQEQPFWWSGQRDDSLRKNEHVETPLSRSRLLSRWKKATTTMW